MIEYYGYLDAPALHAVVVAVQAVGGRGTAGPALQALDVARTACRDTLKPGQTVLSFKSTKAGGIRS